MSKTKFDVDYVAELARISLSPEESAKFGRQLGDVLEYMEQLKTLDISDVMPTMHGHGRINAFREDVVRPSLDRDDALKNAPERTEMEFRLPKFVEDAE